MQPKAIAGREQDKHTPRPAAMPERHNRAAEQMTGREDLHRKGAFRATFESAAESRFRPVSP
jgi:hypothetical protein